MNAPSETEPMTGYVLKYAGRIGYATREDAERALADHRRQSPMSFSDAEVVLVAEVES